jgi:hypothetical protein
MVFHPPSIVVEIVSTKAGNQGRSCKEHPVNCGEVLELDVRCWTTVDDDDGEDSRGGGGRR